MYEIDLFELTDKNDIKAVSNEMLRKELKILLLDIKNKLNLSWKELANQLNTNYQTLWECMNRSKNIPLVFLKNAFILGNCEKKELLSFQRNIQYLVYGKFNSFRRVNAVYTITDNMIKISGAIVSDGYLQQKTKLFSSGRIGEISRIVIRDENKDAVDLCADWFNKVFDIGTCPKKDENHYYIQFGNKIVFRYFSKIMGIPTGKKSRIVNIPKQVYLSKKFKKEFVKSVFLFDGGINQRTGYAELGLMSKGLLLGISEILCEFGIIPDYTSSKADRNGWRIVIRNSAKLSKFKKLFCEKNTIKYKRLDFHLSDHSDEAKDLKALNENLNQLFRRARPNTVTYGDVLEVIGTIQKEDKIPNYKEIRHRLNRGKTVTYEYLRKLEKFGLVKTYKIKNQKIWLLK